MKKIQYKAYPTFSSNVSRQNTNEDNNMSRSKSNRSNNKEKEYSKANFHQNTAYIKIKPVQEVNNKKERKFTPTFSPYKFTQKNQEKEESIANDSPCKYYSEIMSNTEKLDSGNYKINLIEKRLENLEKVTHFYEDMLRLKDKEHNNSINIEKSRINDLIRKISSMEKQLNSLNTQNNRMRNINLNMINKGSTIESKSSKGGLTDADEIVSNIRHIDNFTYDLKETKNQFLNNQSQPTTDRLNNNFNENILLKEEIKENKLVIRQINNKIQDITDQLKTTNDRFNQFEKNNKDISLYNNIPNNTPTLQNSDRNNQHNLIKVIDDKLLEHIDFFSKKFSEVEMFLHSANVAYEQLVESRIDKQNLSFTSKFEEILKLIFDKNSIRKF